MRSRTPDSSWSPRVVVPRLALAVALVLLNIMALVQPVAAAQTAAPFVTATVAPSDTALYLRLPLDPTTQQWQQVLALAATATGDPALAAVDLNELTQQSGEPFGVDIFLGGEAAIIASDTAFNLLARAATADEPGSEALASMDLTESGFAVAITTPNPELMAIAIRAAIGNTASELETEIERTSVDGVPVISVAVPAGSGETPIAFARVGDIILVAGFPADLVPLIETSTGTRSALSDSTDFQQAMATVDADRFAFGYASTVWPESFRRALVESGVPPAALPPVGPAAGFALWAEATGFALDAVVFGVSPAPGTGDFPAVSALSGAPADTLAYVAGKNLYTSGVFQALVAVAFGASATTTADPQGQLEQALAPLSDSFGTDLVGDFLAQITGDYAAWVQVAGPDGPVNAVLTAGLNDPSPVRDSLSQVSFRIQSVFEGDDNITTQAIGERGRVYVANTGEPAIDPLSYGVIDDEFVLGTGTGATLLGDADAALTANPLYAESLGALPAPNIAALYVNLGLAIPLASAMTGEPILDAVPSDSPAATEQDATGDDQFDADPACGGYADQPSAQAAYDEFAVGSFALDRDFDGQACEDFFATASALATPVATPVADPVETAAAPNASPVTAVGVSMYEQDGLVRVGARFLIEDGSDTEP